MGIALGACTIPQSGVPSFELKENEVIAATHRSCKACGVQGHVDGG